MKRITMLLVGALALALVACQKESGTTASSAGLRHSNTYGTDDQWWKCDLTPSKGCDAGSLADLGLSTEEQEYVTKSLAAVPWPPLQATPENVAAALGNASYQTFVGKQIFQGIGPGSSPDRGVSVYHFKGHVNMIHWYMPGRFLLVKQHPEPS